MASHVQNDYKSTPIQLQPHLLSENMVGSYPFVPPGLEPLIEVNEVILDEKVFQTSDGADLFHVYYDSECCGSSMYITLKNPMKKPVAFLHLRSEGGCCKPYRLEMHIQAPRGSPAGYAEVSKSLDQLTFSIQNMLREATFTAELSTSLRDDQTIQILSVNQAHPVAQISKVKSEKSNLKGKKLVFTAIKSKLTKFQFPRDMDVKMKVVILGFYLFMSYCLRGTSHTQNTSYEFDAGYWSTSWVDCGGGDFGGGGGDGGDCGGGDCGGGDGGGCGGDGGGE